MALRRRLAILLALAGLGLAAVWVRAAALQVVGGERWRRLARESRSSARDVEAPRGRILDAAGRPLAHDRGVLRLAFCAEEWATRARFRCRSCGLVHFRSTPEWSKPRGGGAPRGASAPTRCSCGTRLPSFDVLPEEDLAPLEAAIGVPNGSLAAFASSRMADAETRVETAVTAGVLGFEESALTRAATEQKRPLVEVLAELRPALVDADPFRVEALRSWYRQEAWSRETLVSELPGGAMGPVLVRRLPDDAVRLLELDADGRYRGYRATPATERWYPLHALMAQCLGFADLARANDVASSPEDEDGRPEITPSTRVGRAGLERQYDAVLRGRRGRERLEKDDDGGFGVRVVERPARPGEDVRLYLAADACVEAQKALESALAVGEYALPGAPSGGFVGIDADTGAVLWWAEAPTFDLDDDRSKVSRLYDEADEDAVVRRDLAEAPPMESTPILALSRVAGIAVEPGSAMKLVSALALLEDGTDPRSFFTCTGLHGAERPHCSHDHEPVDLVGALAVSCNRYFAVLASLATGIDRRLDSFRERAISLGFAQRTGVDLPFTRGGSYPKELSPGLLRNVAIGQAMTTTPLQMARVAAFYANGRSLPVPRLAAEVGGTRIPLGGTDVAISPAHLASIRAGMRACVAMPGGTAYAAFERARGLAGVAVYGKTGTAQAGGREFDPQADRDPGPYHLWFVGYAEKPGQPRVAFAMALHARASGSGGGEAAPAVARFLAWWFGGRP